MGDDGRRGQNRMRTGSSQVGPATNDRGRATINAANRKQREQGLPARFRLVDLANRFAHVTGIACCVVFGSRLPAIRQAGTAGELGR